MSANKVEMITTSFEHVVCFEDVMWLIIVQGVVTHETSKATAVFTAKHKSHLLRISIDLHRKIEERVGR
jgi:hypothetical protein